MSPKGDALESGARVPALDGLRGIAILLVMFSHLLAFGGMQRTGDGIRYMDNLFYRLSYSGWIGVDLFFVLSGFLITGILLDAKGGRHYFRNFYARRFLRIFPIYYTYLLILFVVLPRLLDLGPDFSLLLGGQAWYWSYTQNLHVALDGWDSAPGVGHFWSLAIEEQFYFVWPAVVFFLARRRLLLVCVLLIVMSLLARTVAVMQEERLAAFVLTPARMDTLAVGALVAVLVRKANKPERLLRWGWTIAGVSGVGILALFITKGYLGDGDPVMLTVGLTLVAAFFGATVAIAVATPPHSPVVQVFSSRVLTFFGRYSYGLYVLHIPVILIVAASGLLVATLPRLMGSQIPGQILFVAVGASLSVAAALLSWRFIESPFLRMKGRFPYHGPGSMAPAAGSVELLRQATIAGKPTTTVFDRF